MRTALIMALILSACVMADQSSSRFHEYNAVEAGRAMYLCGYTHGLIKNSTIPAVASMHEMPQCAILRELTGIDIEGNPTNAKGLK